MHVFFLAQAPRFIPIDAVLRYATLRVNIARPHDATEHIVSIRNLAIIAHVDHGKTTLVDALLRQSNAIAPHRTLDERALDRGDLERERGITILSKVTGIAWKDVHVNIVDTPGHADFGGEVERIVSMVEGAILLVDAVEGPMPQTKFVLTKTLEAGLRPIVMINKIDRPEQRAEDVLGEVFDLFASLGADEHQLDFPALYGSSKLGWASTEPDNPATGLDALLDTLIAHVPEPEARKGPFSMLASILESDPFLGRILTGRIHSGEIEENMPVQALSATGDVVETGRITRIMKFEGLQRIATARAGAGDIVALCGLDTARVSDTLCAPGTDTPLPATPIGEPTLSMAFFVNDGPLAGKEGTKVQSRAIAARLVAETRGNAALRVARADSTGKDAQGGFLVSGRGELQLAILIETMRREGFEFCVGRPEVVFRTGAKGERLEPIEEIVVDVEEAHSGDVIALLAARRGVVQDMRARGENRVLLVIHAPTRGLIGILPDIMSKTHGNAIVNRLFHGYEPHRGPLSGRESGALVANSDGEATAYALAGLAGRGTMLIAPGAKVYRGMIIGEHSRGNDLEVNATRGKQLTNVRAAGKDSAIRLSPPRTLSLEAALAFIAEDEWLEVTPQSMRLRKSVLDPTRRKQIARAESARR